MDFCFHKIKKTRRNAVHCWFIVVYLSLHIMRVRVVIAGFTEAKGRRKHLGALVMGVYKRQKLVYVGHVGVGFDQETMIKLKKRLRPLIKKESSFPNPPRTNAPVTWVKPKLVAEINFAKWTEKGVMFHPIFVSLLTKR